MSAPAANARWIRGAAGICACADIQCDEADTAFACTILVEASLTVVREVSMVAAVILDDGSVYRCEAVERR